MQRPAPSADEVRAALDRVLGGELFRTAKRSADLLRYVVNAALKAPGQPVKEYELGAQALGRGEKFDPRFDPIARVEASRVRNRLELHYAGEGTADIIRIEIPKGGYTPVFSHRQETPTAAAGKPSMGRREFGLWAAFGVVAAALVVAVAMLASSKPQLPSSAGMRTFDTALGAPGVLADQVGNSLVLSPDGKTLLMHVLLDDGSTRMFVRKLDLLESKATELPGTAGAFQPFFSPDGLWVGFFLDRKLKKTLVDGGGSPVTLGDVNDGQGFSWRDDGYILASLYRNNTLARIPENGGDWTTQKMTSDPNDWTSWPNALPGGKGVIFTAFDRRTGQTCIAAARNDGSGLTIITRNGTYARYSPSGHVLFLDRGTLFAVEFDIDSFTVKGTPRPVIRDVAFREPFGYAFFDVAKDGTLVYLRSTPSVIKWLDGGDKSRPILSEPKRYLYPRLSPDGRKLTYAVSEGATSTSHVLDTESGSTIKLPESAGARLWAADGKRIFFSSPEGPGLSWREADGSGDAHELFKGLIVPWSLSPDGKRIAAHVMSNETHFDLWTFPVTSGPDGITPGEPELFLRTPAIETYPAISPDGKWMLYNSNQSSDFDIYVRSIPDNGRPVPVSSSGGRSGFWSKTSNEIFYATNDHRVMVLPWSVRNGEFSPGAPRLFAEQQLSSTGVIANYALAPDGKSVVALVPSLTQGRRERDQISVVINFFDELRRPRPN